MLVPVPREANYHALPPQWGGVDAVLLREALREGGPGRDNEVCEEW
ncbi:hypothetical protein [Vulcanisaeta souniana]|nr:hypothetical protein [Vulcanisaeta souniana]